MLRFGLFYLRDEASVFAGLKTAQLLSLGIGTAAVAWLLWLARPRIAVLRSGVPR